MSIRFRSRTWFSAAATAAVLITLSGCLSADERTSNLSTSDDDSVGVIEARLKDSARVTEIVDRIDRALKPVADVLSDVEKVMKADEKQAAHDKIAEIRNLSINVLRRELEKMKRGLVEKTKDGNWEVDETVKWPFDRDSAKAMSSMACSASDLALVGAPVNETTEEVSVVLADCALPSPTTLLRATVTEDLRIQADLNLGDLEQLLKPGAAKGPCSIEGDGDGVQLECSPFSETVNGVLFNFEKISYLARNRGGSTMDFSISIVADPARDDDWKALRATVHQDFGGKPVVKIDRL
jgi:hypothetical protein